MPVDRESLKSVLHSSAIALDPPIFVKCTKIQDSLPKIFSVKIIKI